LAIDARYLKALGAEHVWRAMNGFGSDSTKIAAADSCKETAKCRTCGSTIAWRDLARGTLLPSGRLEGVPLIDDEWERDISVI
jgi:hypothetical protein